jgi:uncharacterized protein (TIGR03435 family)
MTTIQFLVGWAVRSSILILAGAALVWLLRVKNPAIRLTAWTALLAGSMAIPALMTVLPKVPIAIMRSLGRPPAAPPPTAREGEAVEFAAPAADLGAIPAAGRSVAAKPFDWTRFAALVYGLTAAALLLRLFTGLIVSLRIVRQSRDSGITEDGIEIRESRHVTSPATVGIIRPAVLLPVDWRAWDSAKLDAVLAHERSHIRRRDPAVQFVSAIHRALLWASPASWLLHRSIVRAAEEVSDDDAVAAACDRVLYAEILLEFMQRGVGETNWPRVAMARYDRPEKRIRRVLNSTDMARGVPRWGLIAIVTLGAPLAYLAAAAHPQTAPQPVPTAVPAAPTSAGAKLASVEPPLPAESPSAPSAATPLPAAAEASQQSRPAQETTAAELPQFDVASVKPTDPSVPHMTGAHIYPGGRLEVAAANFKSLVATAFGLAYWQISGGEAWTEKENYDIEAKPPEDLRASIRSLRYSWYEIRDEHLRAMLQALLINRFQLQFHRETRTGDVYLLERSGKTLRLHPVEIPDAEDDATGNSGFESIGYAGGQWDISNAGMQYLTKFATNFIFHVPVSDRTGLNGLYHYRQAVPDSEPKYGGDQSESFLNFLSEMGLKLERTKGPVEMLVIDHASRPSPN